MPTVPTAVLTNERPFVNQHAPGPWRVDPRRSPRSMYAIRDANNHVVAYTYNAQVAAFIVEQRGTD